MTEGLHKIAGCENPVRVADVVFVHGLDGDAYKTWQAKPGVGALMKTSFAGRQWYANRLKVNENHDR